MQLATSSRDHLYTCSQLLVAEIIYMQLATSSRDPLHAVSYQQQRSSTCSQLLVAEIIYMQLATSSRDHLHAVSYQQQRSSTCSQLLVAEIIYMQLATSSQVCPVIFGMLDQDFRNMGKGLPSTRPPGNVCYRVRFFLKDFNVQEGFMCWSTSGPRITVYIPLG